MLASAQQTARALTALLCFTCFTSTNERIPTLRARVGAAGGGDFGGGGGKGSGNQERLTGDARAVAA